MRQIYVLKLEIKILKEVSKAVSAKYSQVLVQVLVHPKFYTHSHKYFCMSYSHSWVWYLWVFPWEKLTLTLMLSVMHRSSCQDFVPSKASWGYHHHLLAVKYNTCIDQAVKTLSEVRQSEVRHPQDIPTVFLLLLHLPRSKTNFDTEWLGMTRNMITWLSFKKKIFD